MSAVTVPGVDQVTVLCRELLRLAKAEEDCTAEEAARTPYWSPCPPSVLAHRAAARALRADAQRLEAEARRQALAS